MNIDSFDFNKFTELFPEINDLKDIKQNPVYHNEGDVFTHTKKVCTQILRLEEWQALNDDEKFILYMSALFHDIGKVICTKIEDGKIVSPKHAVRGAKIFRELIYKKYAHKYNIDYYTRESIASLIKYHMLPVLFMDKEDMEREIVKTSECVNMKILYLLSKCDILGRECLDKDDLLDTVENFKEYAKEIKCYYNRRGFSNSYSRFLYLNYNNINLTDEVYDSRKFKVIVMVGIPLAGKDTYIETHYNSLPVISLDSIRDELGISPRDGSKKVATIAKERAKVLLREKKSFVYNATNIMKKTRDSLCKLFNDYNAKVEYIYIETPYKELMKRYNKRDRIVPKTAIDKMIRKIDMVDEYEGESIIRNV